MDFISHGLWSGMLFESIHKVSEHSHEPTFNFPLVVFWGVFPDALAFVLPVVWIIYSIVVHKIPVKKLWRERDNRNPAPINFPKFFQVDLLYKIGHSIFIFLAAFFLTWFIFGRPIWEMSAWLLHIFIDIPTHSKEFFATPFLWPISNWRYDGITWARLAFLIPNYTAIFVVYCILIFWK